MTPRLLRSISGSQSRPASQMLPAAVGSRTGWHISAGVSFLAFALDCVAASARPAETWDIAADRPLHLGNPAKRSPCLSRVSDGRTEGCDGGSSLPTRSWWPISATSRPSSPRQLRNAPSMRQPDVKRQRPQKRRSAQQRREAGDRDAKFSAAFDASGLKSIPPPDGPSRHWYCSNIYEVSRPDLHEQATLDRPVHVE